jgi:NAD(P)-dependent dehydrogenase (short-subunit alcohol dehydrogenase family)
MLVSYNASKGAVRLMTKSVALECAQAGFKIRVNSIHPGIIDTPMMEQMVTLAEAAGETAEAARTRLASRHPLKRLGRDTDIGNAVRFLASDAAGFMTGSELVVDGGMTAS